MFDLAIALALSSAAWTPRLPICVAVAPTVPAPVARRALDEADAIWRSARIAIDWHENACDRESFVTVRIGDETARAASTDKHVLGWIRFTAPHRPEPRIILSPLAAEQMLDRERQYHGEPEMLREIRLGLALGRALAHEIGHYLLRSAVHPETGLMRATHSSTALLAIGRIGFSPTDVEARRAARQVGRLAWCSRAAPRRRLRSRRPAPHQH